MSRQHVPPTLVVVPTYNERGNLPTLVEQLMNYPDVSALVVDDRSPDGTGEVADVLARRYPGRLAVLHRTGHKGFGRSYVDGLSAAVARPVELVCQMDADLSHDPRQLPALVDAASHADVVVGSRYVPGGAVVNWPLWRRALSRSANAYVRAVTHLQVHDCTSGFRVWRREALERLPLQTFRSDGYSFLVELLFAAAGLGLSMTEVPITFVERREGQSKMSLAVVCESALTPWRLVARGRSH
jgi:dolichol-phosphate mannosyltransferase